MTHVKVTEPIKKRIVSYNKHLWEKFKGLEEKIILTNLPETLQDEILIHLFKE